MNEWMIWLKKSHIVSGNQTKKLEEMQKKSGASIGGLILEQKILDSNSYLKILVTESSYPLATPGILNSVPPGITNILSPDTIKEFKCFPLGVIGRRLQVAFLDPTDVATINEICQASGMEIEPYCCHPDDLLDAIQKTYDLPSQNLERENNVVNIAPAEKKKKSVFDKLNPFKKEKKVAAPNPIMVKTEEKEKEITKSIEPHEIKQEKEQEEVTKKIERKISLVSPFAVKENKPKSIEKKQVTLTQTVLKTQAKDVSLSPFFKPKLAKIETAPPADPQSIFTPEATTNTFDALKNKMEQVKTKEEVVDEILGWLKKQNITRGAILIVQKNLIIGWRGFGYNLEGPSAARIKLPLDEPSVFKTVADTKEFFDGRLPKNEVEETFVTFLQNRPSEIFIAPAVLNDRVFAFIFAEPKPGETINPTKKILPLSEALSLGFTTLIKNKRG